MGNFNRDRSGGDRGRYQSRGRSSFGGGRGFDRGGSRGDRPMFSAICSNCGKECQVPFRPTNGKPVYCSDCFEKMGGRNDSRSNDRSRFEDQKPSFDQNKAQFDSINAKLDKILGILAPVAPAAPVIKEEKKADTQKVAEEVKAPKVKKVVKKAAPTKEK